MSFALAGKAKRQHDGSAGKANAIPRLAIGAHLVSQGSHSEGPGAAALCIPTEANRGVLGVYSRAWQRALPTVSTIVLTVTLIWLLL